MDKLVRDAIARIDIVRDGASTGRGTGTLVTDRLVLTALHVVADRSQTPPVLYPGTIRLTFPGGVTDARIHRDFMDATADWVLLECLTPPRTRPLPLAEPKPGDVNFVTYGFPDAQPLDGMVQSGRVENIGGEIFGVSAIQLYSDQAAAGDGAPIKGLSGAPLLIENALAGVIRVSLMQDKRNVAGTLYACPLSLILERCGDLLPLPDPCRGLPGLTRQDLPANPFRFLDRFTDKDAEIFFGRNADIRSLYDRLTGDESAPIVLVYGQSGVGKSSFLDAGVRPRLSRTHEVRYAARDANATLLDTVQRVLTGEPHLTRTTPEQLGATWRLAEDQAARPVVVLLDEVDRVFTRPRVDGDEVAVFFRALQALGRAGDARPAGRLVLSFRKDFLPELQSQLDSRELSYSKVFLKALDRAAIVEVVSGLTSTRRLREHFGLEIEPAVPGLIADDLLTDRASAIAPTLQILLGKLWQEACAKDRAAPRFTADQYQTLHHKGLLLGDFLNQQLEHIRTRQPEFVASGLALDVLAFHTTPLLTSEQRSRTELEATYASRVADLRTLADLFRETYLLMDASGDSGGTSGATRLGHDSLASLVRAQFDKSVSPGQRARRLTEGRTPRPDDRESGLLDAADLKVVRAGLRGMRDLLPEERALLRASDARLRLGRFSRRAAIAALVVLFVGFAYEFNLKTQREAQLREPLEKLGWSTEHARNPKPEEIAASLAADADLQAVDDQVRRVRAEADAVDLPAGADSRAGETALQYQPVGVDAGKVIANLRETFSVVDSGEHLAASARTPAIGIPRHAIHFGDGVPMIAVQKVAYTIVRAGVAVCDIGSFDDPVRQAGIIRVEQCPDDNSRPNWNVDRIRSIASVDVVDPVFRQLPDMVTFGQPNERPVGTRGSFQRFEKGRALWIESENAVVNVLTDDGQWLEYRDDIPAGRNLELPPNPKGKNFNPRGGFRRSWLQHQLETVLGWPEGPEVEITDLTLQHFSGGFMLRPLREWKPKTFDGSSVLVITTAEPHERGKDAEKGKWATPTARR